MEVPGKGEDEKADPPAGSNEPVDRNEENATSAEAGATRSPTEELLERKDSNLTIENLKRHQDAYPDAERRSLSCSPGAAVGPRTTPDSASRSSTPLGPVRVPSAGRVQNEVTNADRGESLRTGSGRPLPPIGAERQTWEVTDQVDGEDESGEPQTAMSSHPTILQRPFRRESLRGQELDADMLGHAESERCVSFQDSPPHRTNIGRQSPATREVHHNVVDGEERVSVSIATETEWSWLESLKIAGIEERAPTPISIEKSPPPPRKLSTPSHDSDLSDMDEPGGTDGEEGYGRTSGVLPPLEIDVGSEYSETDLADRDDLIPSIGPPRIIQYQREVHRPYPNESPLPPYTSDTPEDFRRSLLDVGRDTSPAHQESLVEVEGGGAGMPLPTVSDASIHLPDIQEEGGETYCEFCNREIKQFPTQEMRETFTEEELYCCEEYQHFVEFAIAHSPLSAQLSEDLIDIAPHAPYGSKQARRAAKERAAARLREREMARQRAAGANQANFYAFARQMKTINYALSSQRCMDEGWTIRPVTPEDTPTPLMAYETVDHTEPTIRPKIKAAEMKRGPILERFYPAGERFMIMFRDGSGTVYYPSGKPAIQIVKVGIGRFTYIAQDVVNKSTLRGALLAVFEPNGRGTCYHKNGNIRLNLDQNQGLFSDSKGAVKKRWHWWDQSAHVHAPPFQPICFALNSMLSIRCLAQDQIYLGFSHDKMNLRFNVGVKLKLVAPENIPVTEIDEDTLYLSEVRAYVQLVMDKINNQLQFSNSPKLGDLHPPRKLKNDFLRNDQRKQELSKQRAAGRETPIVTVK